MTLAVSDHDKIDYTIEHAHTSIGYYSTLAAFGFLDTEVVVEKFRRGLDIAGHVSWVPGGTQLSGGRLGVMIPVAVGQALGKKAIQSDGAWVVCHCGDAGWISGQALNGFNGADLHNAPITFVMHRNGIQLSGTNKSIMDKDPRPVIESLGIRILEIPSLHEADGLYAAYREAYQLAQQGRPSLIYPAGFRSRDGKVMDLNAFAAKHGITKETEAFAAKHGVKMDTEVWVPGALMSYRDVESMLQCVFLVNELEGGEGHHDGHMKGRDVEEVLSNPMMQFSEAQKAALEKLQGQPKQEVVTEARPAVGSPNLVLSDAALAEVELPAPGKKVSARAGVQAAYAAVAKAHPDNVFVVSCDLDPSTKLGKARGFLKPDHQFEMSIEEQVAALMADGLAMSSTRPQLNVFSTFAAFYEGIAREGMELWRYQRNLTGANEGVNATMHMSHVGSCTGRDHFSGWSLDWINMGLSYLPYLHRFYTPADARGAFIAVRDLAAHYGGHIIGVPRDNLPILTKQGGDEPLWDAKSPFEAVTHLRANAGAKKAILAVGATGYLGAEASEKLSGDGVATDAYVVNGFPLAEEALTGLVRKYPEGIVTIEDGIIASRRLGLRGFAGVVAGAAYGSGVALEHLGIADPRVAPAEGHEEVWEHFGLTTDALVDAVKSL
jgi:transketolase N-terminal domain/subunit/transketolase C-terminal domain/subunit